MATLTTAILNCVFLPLFLVFAVAGVYFYWSNRELPEINVRRPISVVISALSLVALAISRNILVFFHNQVSCAADVLFPIIFFFMASTMFMNRAVMLQIDVLRSHQCIKFVESRN